MTEIVESSTEVAEIRDKLTSLKGSQILKNMGLNETDGLMIALKGKELGLDPMASLSGIYVVKGKPFISANILRGLILRDGHTMRVIADEWNSKKCVILAARRGDEPQRFEFTHAEAQHMGVASKDVWRQHPKRMLLHACTRHVANAVFPDYLLGLQINDGTDPEVQPQRKKPNLNEINESNQTNGETND